MLENSLQLPGGQHIAVDADQLYDDLGVWLTDRAVKAVKDRGVFHLALSGGSTPEPFYRRLVIDPRFRVLPWERTHLWVVDERRVAMDDPRCNFRMIRETLVDHVPLAADHVHPMPTVEDDAAERYEARLRQITGVVEGVPRLDFVLLGMGDDCHTASLFPHSPALAVKDHLVAINDGEHVTPPDRLTMTFPLLNAARALAVLCCGAKKTAALLRVHEQHLARKPDIRNMPITGIEPTDGEMMWFLDAAAAGHQ